MDQDKVAQNEQVSQTQSGNEESSNLPNTGELVYEAKKARKKAQEAQAKVEQLQSQIKAIEDAKLKEQENYKQLSERLEEENDSLKNDADKGRKLVDRLKSEALESLPEEGRKFAEDMDVEKAMDFVKYFDQQTKPATTNESASSPTPSDTRNPFSELSKDERQANWDAILQSYQGRN
jgi:type II secretory pathway pseudopilin PulG